MSIQRSKDVGYPARIPSNIHILSVINASLVASVSVKYSYVYSLTEIYIIITMVILSMIEVFRFSILETLFNPILSDSFGLNERGSSYVFLGFGVVDIVGAILL